VAEEGVCALGLVGAGGGLAAGGDDAADDYCGVLLSARLKIGRFGRGGVS